MSSTSSEDDVGDEDEKPLKRPRHASVVTKVAKKSVEKLQSLSLTSSDDEREGNKDEKKVKRPRHVNIVANAIEKFVTMAIEGKRVMAANIIDDIPSDFSTISW